MDYHKPVLYDETIENIITDGRAVYVDCTLGGGGHTEGILKNSSADSKVIGIDQDIEAINFSKERLKDYKDKLEIFQDNFKNLDTVIYLAGYDKVDRILKEIADIIYKYGEEPKSRRIARNIVEYRKNQDIETTTELADIVIKSIGKSMKRHPAKRTFQAIRIFVNKELEVLTETLDKAINLLNPKGRLLVITFHSLEDRIVKEKFREFENPCTCPSDIPICVCNKKSLGKVITRKPIVAKNEELAMNNRAHSAKLRIFERGE